MAKLIMFIISATLASGVALAAVFFGAIVIGEMDFDATKQNIVTYGFYLVVFLTWARAIFVASTLVTGKAILGSDVASPTLKLVMAITLAGIIAFVLAKNMSWI